MIEFGRTTKVWLWTALAALASSTACNDDADRVEPPASGAPNAGSGMQSEGGDAGTGGSTGGTREPAGGAHSAGDGPGTSGAAGGAGEAGSTGAGGESGSGGSGASGGSGGTPIVPPDGPGFEFEAIALPGVSVATDFGFIPGREDELLVLTHSGKIHHLRQSGSGYEAVAQAELPDVYYSEGCGLFSVVFDPEFEENHYVYLGYCTSHFESRLTRHVFTSIDSIADSAVDILTVAVEESPAEEWHRWGSMGFEPDGETMWVFLGDSFIKANGQDTSEKFGSLLRIKPARNDDESGYVPAAGNAFETEEEGDPSVYAYGFRSPWRGARDRRGRFWIGDVGLVTYEEVNLITAAGQNFGWSREEGPCDSSVCDDVVDPKAYYGRTEESDDYTPDDPDAAPNVRRAVWVGQVYDSPSVDRYFGFHDDLTIFGDFFLGWVRGLRVNDDGEVTDDIFLGHLPSVASFRTGPDGYMYALVHNGTLQRALPRSPAAE
ncbi:MAG TPA: PQQ-dependent sugar dehydrogenase [Polyangiaceae bacterium]